MGYLVDNSKQMSDNHIMTKQVTIKELSESLGEDYLTTSALVKFCVKLGAVKEVGKKSNPPGQKGKPAVVYEIPNLVELVFWDENDTTEVDPKENKTEEIPPAETPVTID